MLYLVVYVFDIYNGILVITLAAALALLMGAVILKGGDNRSFNWGTKESAIS